MTTTNILAALTGLGALVFGGEMLVFSAFVMPGLRRLPAPAAIAAMQAINVQAGRSVLLLVPLIGTALASLAVVVAALVSTGPGWALQLAGGLCYLVSFVITPAFHIPRNNRLAGLEPDDAAAARYWEQQYYPQWVPMNTVRAAIAIVAGVLLGASLMHAG